MLRSRKKIPEEKQQTYDHPPARNYLFLLAINFNYFVDKLRIEVTKVEVVVDHRASGNSTQMDGKREMNTHHSVMIGPRTRIAVPNGA